MRFFYSLGIIIYGMGVRIAALWNPQARLLAKGWRHSFDNLSRLQGKEVAWFHAASLGEFEQARPVLEQFHRQHPTYAICLTFFSPSGYEVRKDYNLADVIAYLPLDTPRLARRWVKELNPQVTFFVKYEFWYNMLINLKESNIPTYIFSAIFRPSQYFFRPCIGRWFRNQLQCYSHIFVQNEESCRLLNRVGLSHVSIAGDTRFDRVHDIASQAPAHPEVEKFISNKPVLLAGSSWDSDEENLHYFLQHYTGDIKLILAPHMIDEAHLQRIEALFDHKTVRYTHLNNDAESTSQSVLIIDNIGMLSSLYRYATIAYIGGGFGKGIHNILEAVTFGKPVAFGPNYLKFKEAVDIIAEGGGYSYHQPQELAQQLTRWLTDPATYQQASRQCLQYLERNLGATNTILSTIHK